MNKEIRTPEEIYGPLFYDIQKAKCFDDSNVFINARALLLPSIILKKYEKAKEEEKFDLLSFIIQYFELPNVDKVIDSADTSIPLENFLISHWRKLEHPKDKPTTRSSKIALPHPYILSGNGSKDLGYWSSYFTMLGLVESNRLDLVENTVQNFRFLIDTLGHIPARNRSYLLSRSQPPFYSLMVKLLIHHKGPAIISTHMSSLIKEYNFWMDGIDKLKEENTPVNRIIKVDGSFLLNRYYDSKDTPREESYREDWEKINFSETKSNLLFENLRATSESGWDSSSRWFSDLNDDKSNRSIELLPIDLNCLLWHMEKLISECYDYLEKGELSLQYGIIANQRKKTIQTIFWAEQKQFFFDYDLKNKSTSDRFTLAGIFPLFFGIATKEQANSCAKILKKNFLQAGGLVTTPCKSGYQWDAPYGWAPLQWIAIKGLLNYDHKDLAREIALRWTRLNEQVYQQTGKILEKYNVVDIDLNEDISEVPMQNGYAWTNGIYLAIKNA